jgi:hypothetical protein
LIFSNFLDLANKMKPSQPERAAEVEDKIILKPYSVYLFPK